MTKLELSIMVLLIKRMLLSSKWKGKYHEKNNHFKYHFIWYNIWG